MQKWCIDLTCHMTCVYCEGHIHVNFCGTLAQLGTNNKKSFDPIRHNSYLSLTCLVVDYLRFNSLLNKIYLGITKQEESMKKWSSCYPIIILELHKVQTSWLIG